MEIFARGADSLEVTARDRPVLECRLVTECVGGCGGFSMSVFFVRNQHNLSGR